MIVLNEWQLQRIWRIPKGHQSNSSFELLPKDLTRGPPLLWCAYGSMMKLSFFSHHSKNPFRSQMTNHKNPRVHQFSFCLSGFSVLAFCSTYLETLSQENYSQ